MVQQIDNRTATALSVAAAQAVITLLVSAVTLGFFGKWAAWSICAGGAVCLAVNAFFSLRIFCGPFEFHAGKFLRRLYRAEIQKLILTVVMFYIVIKWTDIGLAQFILGFASASVAYWLILPFTRFEKFITDTKGKTHS